MCSHTYTIITITLIGVQIPRRHGPVDRVQRRTVQSQLSAVFRNESSEYNIDSINVNI